MYKFIHKQLPVQFDNYFNSSSSSNLFQSQRSLKSQLKQKQSMLTIIFTGNREEAK